MASTVGFSSLSFAAFCSGVSSMNYGGGGREETVDNSYWVWALKGNKFVYNYYKSFAAATYGACMGGFWIEV